ncbi:MAG: hypothetical protein IJ545_02500 [Alphaproteobacteria bacterium]|nr:hypothetical protein [Alphaproteobacteria bacterium]
MDKKTLENIYNLQGKRVDWAVIEEKTSVGVTYKPGLVIRGSKLYIDLLSRRFYTPIELSEISRKAYPAKRVISKKNGIEAFFAKEDASKNIVLSLGAIQDAYSVAWYTPKMEEQVLL